MSTFVTNRNYVRAIGIHNLSLVTRNKGMADSDVLISSVYHILFLNYYADTYTYEAMSAIKSNKSLYRFRIKKHVDAALAFLNKYEKDINSIMGIKYGDNFFEMNNGITDRFQKVFDKLKAEIYRTFEEKQVQDVEIASRVMMAYMFNACKNLIEVPQLDTSNVLDISHMFDRCSRLTSIPMLNTSKTTAMHGLFYGCTNLTEVPQLNTSSTTDMSGMFENCTSLTAIPLLDTSNVSDARSMFYGCTSLTTVPQMDFSSATDAMNMFYGCTSLTEAPQMNLSRAQYVDNMFDGCTSLTTVHPLNTSGAMRMKYMFAGCTSLTTVEGINFRGLQESLTYLFGTSTSMPNIKRFIVNGWIDVNIKDNYSIKALTAIDYDSVKSILEAADRTTKTNSRTLAFNRTMSDPDRELSILVSSCMSKGWSITGLTLQ